MRKLRKVLSLIIVAAMVLSMGIIAGATSAPATQPTITLKLPETPGQTDQEDGHTYKAYQVFAGSVEGKTISVTGWGKDLINTGSIISELKANDAFKAGDPAKNVFDDCTDAASVAKVLSQNPTMAVDFAKALNSHVARNSGTELTKNTAVTVDPGYYLIKDWGPTGSDDDFISANILEVVKNVEVEPKGSKPIPDKRVTSQETAPAPQVEEPGSKTAVTEIGKKVYYTLKGTISKNVDSFGTYFYEFEDHMSGGITFNQIESVVLHNADHNVQATYTAEGANPDYVVTKPDNTMEGVTGTPANGGGTLKITFANLKGSTETLLAANMPNGRTATTLTVNDHVYVVYSAYVNKNAIQGGIGNDNDVVINYSNNPNTNDKGKSEPSEASVFTLELDVDKVNAKNNDVTLKGAEFVLRRGTEGSYQYAIMERVTDWKKDGDDQLYYPKTFTWNATDKKWDVTEDKNSEVKTADATIVDTDYDAEEQSVKDANPRPTVTGANAKVPKSQQMYYPTTTTWNTTTKKWETTSAVTLTSAATGTLVDTGYDAEDAEIKTANPKPAAPANKPGPIVRTGDYILTGWTGTKAEATTLSTELDGEYVKLMLKGLEAATYALEETKAPAGYDLPAAPNNVTTVTIAATADGSTDQSGANQFKLNSLTIKVGQGEAKSGDTVNGIVATTIENSNDLTLPSTGGIGTYIFYALGGILVLGAAIMLVVRKRVNA